MIATCESWYSTATLPALLSKSFSLTGLSPGVLNLSRHVSEKLTCPRDASKAALAVLALLARRRFDCVVIADDALFRALAGPAGRGVLGDWFPVDATREDVVALVTSKHELAERATALGILTPESRRSTSREDCVRTAREFGYPAVLKGPYGYSGSEVRIAYNEDALRAASEPLLTRYGEVLLQRHVSGASASVAVCYRRGRPRAYKAYLTECPYPRPHSAATVHRPLEHPSVEPVVRALGAATGFNGMAGIDFVLEEGTGRLFTVEFNPRPTSAFSGLRADRAFFESAVAYLGEDQDLPLARYPRTTVTQAYFPDYLFYFLDCAAKNQPESYALLARSLAAAPACEFPVVTWAIARYAYDRLGAHAPALRGWLDRRRGAISRAPSLPRR